MTIMILTITVFMLFGFSVVTLYFTVKIHQMLQVHTSNQDKRVYDKQEDLRRLDIFGLMPKLSNPKFIDIMSLLGRAILDRNQSLNIEATCVMHEAAVRLTSICFQVDGNTLLITLEQENFLQDQVALYRIKAISAVEPEMPYEEYLTHEAHFIEWMDEALREFSPLEVKKISKS